MPWEVEYTDEFGEWFQTLDADQQLAIAARVELLEAEGPNLRRPVVGEIISSRLPNMKELRCSERGDLRVLFAFDPRRTAILLLGGNKAGQWEQWYATAVPQAEALYDQYLKELAAEGLR
jgi:hypothetical protein